MVPCGAIWCLAIGAGLDLAAGEQAREDTPCGVFLSEGIDEGADDARRLRELAEDLVHSPRANDRESRGAGFRGAGFNRAADWPPPPTPEATIRRVGEQFFTPLPLDTYRLPGEFERQQGLLLACRELLAEEPGLFAEIVRETAGRLPVVVLVSDPEEHRLARGVLARAQVRGNHVKYLTVVHDTMWSRDYGPFVVRHADGSAAVVDAEYDFTRTSDDLVPAEIARHLQLPLVQVAMRIEGGNLLSNGRGLCIATTELVDINSDRGLGEDAVCEVLRSCFGAKETVLLEPLAGEMTGHVDMFAAFTDADTVVVGSMLPEEDAENAAILDRNAERLARVRTARGPLRVVRIPMPPHGDGVWRTYTNVIFANGLLLVPVYPGLDEAGRRRAIQAYARLLPGWKIVGLDARTICELGGALHCISMNLGPAPPPAQDRIERVRRPKPLPPVPARPQRKRGREIARIAW